jgi:hypothetical protein
MWPLYFWGVFVCLAILYLPGFLQLKSLSFSSIAAVCIAPAVTLGEYALLGVAFGLAGIPIAWFIMPGMALLISVVLLIFNSLCKGKSDCRTIFADFRIGPFASFLFFGILFGMVYFVKNLDGPSSFSIMFDSGYHLNVIKAFMSTGRYSIVQATSSPTSVDPFADISFYPAGWHVVCALVGSAISCDVPMAVNVGILTFLSFVFPTAMFAFCTVVFRGDEKKVLASSLFILAFVSFPWGFLEYGPLYSNFAALAVLPIMIAIFIRLVDDVKSRSFSIVSTFVLGLVALVALQPNSVFTAVVICSPFVVGHLFQCGKGNSRNLAASAIAPTLFVVFVAAVFVLCYKASFLSGVVHNSYNNYAENAAQAIIDFVNLGYRNAVAQPLLACICILGVLTCLGTSSYRWLIFGWLYFGLAYVSAGGVNGGILNDFLSGFWYNDVDRIAANCSILLIPFAGLGLNSILTLACHWVTTLSDIRSGKTALSLSIAGLVLLINYLPSHYFAGNGWVNTAFGERSSRLEALETYDRSLTSDEIEFLAECKALVGDEPILNMPFDGSVLAYAISDINVVYRVHFAGTSSNERLIQALLNQYTYHDSVKNAIKESGVRYVLLLDVKGCQGNTYYTDHYDAKLWSGLTGIDDNTPGFSIVLSEGDMRLYSIDEL